MAKMCFFILLFLLGSDLGAQPAPLNEIEKIHKIELLNANNAVGLQFSVSGDIKIKHGVIPKSAQQPRRVYFDLSRVRLNVWTPPTYTILKHGVQKMRVAQNDSDRVRMVVEADGSTPFHVKTDKGMVQIWFGEPQESKSVEVPSVRKRPEQSELLGVRRIVIDPGHGGHDPGAIGKGGLKEKDVTLALSKQVKAAIEEQMPGIEVLLTRETDKFLPLSERTEFANSKHADLFISIHVNSSPNRATQGIETYYLNTTHDRYAKRLAARENAMSESEISNLEFILADLAMKSNLKDSVRLGTDIQNQLTSQVQQDWHEVKDLGLKHALFYVLLGARMPSVLVETSFISNAEDEKRLRTKKYQEAIVSGLVRGIEKFSEQKKALYADRTLRN